VAQPLDSVPSMNAGARTRTDLLLMWLASVCLLNECLEM
jgi:hypothetical protein